MIFILRWLTLILGLNNVTIFELLNAEVFLTWVTILCVKALHLSGILRQQIYCFMVIFQHFDGDVSDLSLDFSVTEEMFGKWIVVELRPGGKDVAVTNENKLQYVHAMADYKLNRQV